MQNARDGGWKSSLPLHLDAKKICNSSRRVLNFERAAICGKEETMTVRNAMLQGLRNTSKGDLIAMETLDDLAISNYDGIFQVPTGRRVAQELVAEGVLTREARGVYSVNRKVLTQKLKAL